MVQEKRKNKEWNLLKEWYHLKPKIFESFYLVILSIFETKGFPVNNDIKICSSFSNLYAYILKFI